jgi:ornithine--oxo-acid transaminase
MLLLGKALGGGVYPVSACVTTKDIIGPDVITPGTHGSTFGGNPLACAVAMKSIDIHLRENLAERATEMGAYFIKRLREIGEKRTRIPIKDIRGKGLLIAVEFSEDARHIVEELKDNGILAKDTHSTTIRFAPPLIITREEIDWAIDIIEKTLIQE